jgi:hypothetical protein
MPASTREMKGLVSYSTPQLQGAEVAQAGVCESEESRRYALQASLGGQPTCRRVTKLATITVLAEQQAGG